MQIRGQWLLCDDGIVRPGQAVHAAGLGFEIGERTLLPREDDRSLGPNGGCPQCLQPRERSRAGG